MPTRLNNPTVLPRRLPTQASAQNPYGRFQKEATVPASNLLSLHMQQDVRALRATGRIIEAIRKLIKTEGTVSTALFNLVEIANSGVMVRAYDSPTQQFSPDGTLLAEGILTSFDTLNDYSLGFADKMSVQGVLTMGLLELAISGSLAMELVLNKARLPDRLSIVPIEGISYKSRGDGTKYPVQQQQTGEVPLDLATFWIADLHRDAAETYSTPLLQAALNTTFYYDEFVEDMRRVVRRSGHSRVIVKLDSEKVKAAAPPEVQSDQTKLLTFMEDVRLQAETVLRALEPDDALVLYDTITVESVSAEGEKADYKELLQTLSGLLATSLKSHPSILGLRLTGSQSLSNTESLVYLKVAKSLHTPLEEVLQRALTLACRLYGADVFVKVKFKPINLRPDDELEAFKTMRQSRILELLSLGLLSDEEAALELGVWPLPAGYQMLSGTMFHRNGGSRAEEVTPNADPMGRSLQPDTPSKGGGESQ